MRELVRFWARWGGLSAGALVGCLPADTRPEPGAVRVEFALSSPERLDGGRLRFPTADGFVVTLSRIRLGLGRLRLQGDECKPYGDDDGYLRVLDPLQAGPQPLGLSYGLGECLLQFSLGPAETWAVLNPGVTEADRDRLRATEIEGQETPASFSSGAPIGASLHWSGTAVRADAPAAEIAFEFDFGVDSDLPPCAPADSDGFQMVGGARLGATVEMAPEQLLGGCAELGELRFEAFWNAAARLAESEALTLRELERPLSELAPGLEEFYSLDPARCGPFALPPSPQSDAGSEPSAGEAGAAAAPGGAKTDRPPPLDGGPAAVPTTLRQWLALRVPGLFSLQGGACRGGVASAR